MIIINPIIITAKGMLIPNANSKAYDFLGLIFNGILVLFPNDWFKYEHSCLILFSWYKLYSEIYENAC